MSSVRDERLLSLRRLKRVGPEVYGVGVEGRQGHFSPPLSVNLGGERASQLEAGGWCLWEASGEEAERLALVGRERRSVAIKVSWDAATGGA